MKKFSPNNAAGPHRQQHAEIIDPTKWYPLQWIRAQSGPRTVANLRKHGLSLAYLGRTPYASGADLIAAMRRAGEAGEGER